jgi:iron complex transport system substrate-binding protein
MMKKTLIVILILALSLVSCTIASSAESNTNVKKIADMAGRSVEIPVPLQHVITLGSVPVQNTFIFALDEGETIMTNLPESFKKQGRWKYQYIFAPNLEGAPTVEVTKGQPNVEEIIMMNPDVVFTMDKPTVDLLEKSGVRVIYLSWVNDNDVTQLMTLLGDAYNKQDVAQTYLQYFDTTLNKITAITEKIPENERKKVLYITYNTLTVPHKIGDWWITRAGGISVSDEERSTESLAVDYEQINKWNPDVIIISSPSDLEAIIKDPKLADVTAIKNKAIYIAPMGAHIWANRGIELPLTVMWAAKTIYPEQFKDLDLEKETSDFYKTFFGTDLTAEQIKEILSGKAKT